MEKEKSLYMLLSRIFDLPPSPTGERYEYTWENIFDAIDSFEEWLISVKKEFLIKKNYSNIHIAEQIFSKNEFTHHTCKYHIILIHQSVTLIKKELRKSKENNYPVSMDYIKGKLVLLRDILIDTYELIGKCEKYFLSKPPTFKLYRNRLITSRDIFLSSKNILRRYFYYVDNSFSSASIFLIRQSIETKILNCLGIYNIVDINGKPQKFRIDSLVEFISENNNIEFPIEKSLLLKITKWTNIYIHRGVMDYHWVIMLAHNVLQPLFSMRQSTTAMHIHGAVKINKEYFDNHLYEDILRYLNLTECKINALESGIEALIE